MWALTREYRNWKVEGWAGKTNTASFKIISGRKKKNRKTHRLLFSACGCSLNIRSLPMWHWGWHQNYNKKIQNLFLSQTLTVRPQGVREEERGRLLLSPLKLEFTAAKVILPHIWQSNPKAASNPAARLISTFSTVCKQIWGLPSAWFHRPGKRSLFWVLLCSLLQHCPRATGWDREHPLDSV